MSAIHKRSGSGGALGRVVCDIGGYEFVSYSQEVSQTLVDPVVVCDIGGYEFVSYSQVRASIGHHRRGCL